MEEAVTFPPYFDFSGTMKHGSRASMSDIERRYRQISWFFRERPRNFPQNRHTIISLGPNNTPLIRIVPWGNPRTNTLRPPGMGWEQYPIDRAPWHLPLPMPQPPRDISEVAYPNAAMKNLLRNVEWIEPTAAPPAHSWFLAHHGWITGMVLLALLVVLARAAEKCLSDMKLFKRTRHTGRRQSEEWPAPNVRATSRQQTDNGTVIIPGLENAEPLPADLSTHDTISIDLPPPYSECTAGPSFGPNKLPDYVHEEPPPPYSDCYVEFSNKDGVPSVLIFSRRRTPLLNRREITETETAIEEASSSEPNVVNATTEMVLQGTARAADDVNAMEINETINLISNDEVIEHTHVNTDNNTVHNTEESFNFTVVDVNGGHQASNDRVVTV